MQIALPRFKYELDLPAHGVSLDFTTRHFSNVEIFHLTY
jgi:hypothetical protein